MSVQAKLRTAIRRKLLAWYRNHRRDLPWRAREGETPNAYHVLVSEAMLQQTQVATVIAYFHRFIEAFPTVEALAAADEQRVLRLWQGLGYYRRARNLHASAKVIVEQHGGRVPDSVEALSALPGVGRYTAGAVASIAYGRAEPIVDGNVARVLARWFAIEEAIDAPATKARLWSLAAELVPAKGASDFNQAMMELGALVCQPRGPKCVACPVRGECEAAKRGEAEAYPVKAARRKPRAVKHQVVAIESGGAFLFEKRPAQGLWSNMWQLPTAEELEGDVNAQAIAAWVKGKCGLIISQVKRVDSFTHQTTHRTIEFVVWRVRARARKRKRETNAQVWRKLEAVDDLPLANPQRRAVAMVLER
ncbi:MAG: A/G-specific adenine glycosylase [Phycisphaeraceae bacterium]